ncbi:MAG TPA: pirin-like C-terminal cupin domain-containing protein, partial [Gallionellaceae bacterium]|nr:pirin-like C-terminal cupin domain-containing protein [Gallionellaceae bacterium]
EVRVGETAVGAGKMGVLGNDIHADGVVIRADESACVLLASGIPLNEPIIHYGPFVMNTQGEIYQAVADFQGGRF